jgi:hypothetical protein
MNFIVLLSQHWSPYYTLSIYMHITDAATSVAFGNSEYRYGHACVKNWKCLGINRKLDTAKLIRLPLLHYELSSSNGDITNMWFLRDLHPMPKQSLLYNLNTPFHLDDSHNCTIPSEMN